MTRPRRPRSAIVARLIAMRERAFIGANAGIAAGYALVLVRNLASPDILAATDFTVFWGAWHLILDGRASALYVESAQRATQRLLMDGGYFEGGLMAFLNPPHFALATVPFGWLAEHAGEQAAFAAWTALNLALLACLVRTLQQEWGASTRTERWMLAAAVCGFYPVFVTVKNGQLSLALALAVLGVYRAAKAGRHWAAGAWLTVLTIKPQLVPVVVIYLAAAGRWQVLGTAAVTTSGVAVATAAALGIDVWLDFARRVHYLEQFWGSGTPDYMLNVRGALTRVVGLDRSPSIDTSAYALFFAALAISAAVLWRRRTEVERDTRPDYAFVLAVGLLCNPHLFIHDTVIWIVPLTLCAASMREAGANWRPFTLFALAWPLVFLVAGRVAVRSGPLAWIDPHTWTFVAAIVMIARHLPPIQTQNESQSVRLLTAEVYRSWTS